MGRKQARWAALAAPALALLGGCIGGNLGSFECVSSPQIAFTDGPATAATVGMPYFQGLAASAATLLWPSAWIEPVSVPPGAEVDRHGVRWTPGPELAGTTQVFQVRSDRDFCGRAATLSWSVRVYPAIAISRFEAIPPKVPLRGTPVQLVAEYTGGQGALTLPFAAPLPSGQPLDVGVVGATATFTLAVVNEAGATLERSVTVTAQAPPAIHDPGWNPPVVTVGDLLTLEWQIDGDVTGLTLDPGGVALDPSTRVLLVRPAAPTSYTLTARNDVGDVATAQLTPTIAWPPEIQGFTASPPAPPLGGSVELLPLFTGGSGTITRRGPVYTSVDATPGVPLAEGPLQGNLAYTLTVTNAAGLSVSRDLVVGLSGPGTWALLEWFAMGGRRTGHTATALADGRVLIAGGYDMGGTGATYWPPTELFDPATDAFAPGPAMLHPRANHAAVRLAGGSVLVVGGDAGRGPVGEAELIDPVAGTSQPVASTVEVPSPARMVALPDGSALIHPRFMYLRGQILRYDAAASGIAPLATVDGLGEVRSFLMGDGRVLLLSGGRYGATPSALVDPASGDVAWTGAVLREQDTAFAAVRLGDGRILVSDGLPGAEIYDPVTGAFTWTGDPVFRQTGSEGVLLPDGRVLLVGGSEPFLTYTTGTGRAVLFDPASGTFQETGGTLQYGDRPLTVLPDGSVLSTLGLAERYRLP